MKKTIQAIVLIGLTLVLMFIMYRCTVAMKSSGSKYIDFPNKIETFK